MIPKNLGVIESLLLEWRAYQTAGGISNRTITERAHVIRALRKDPRTVTALDLIAFLGRPGLTASTRATYYASLRAFFKYAVEFELREDMPLDRVPVPRRPRSVPRPITGEQLTALLGAARRTRTRDFIRLAALAGLRVHEIAKIRGEDFDMEAGSLMVTGKGGKTAVLPIHPDLVDLVRARPRSGYWFPRIDGAPGPVGARAVSAAIGRAMERAGITGTPHQIRHWYGSALLAGGADLRTVQELMRHESVQSTQIYTAVPDDRRRAALGAIRLAA